MGGWREEEGTAARAAATAAESVRESGVVGRAPAAPDEAVEGAMALAGMAMAGASREVAMVSEMAMAMVREGWVRGRQGWAGAVVMARGLGVRAVPMGVVLAAVMVWLAEQAIAEAAWALAPSEEGGEGEWKAVEVMDAGGRTAALGGQVCREAVASATGLRALARVAVMEAGAMAAAWVLGWGWVVREAEEKAGEGMEAAVTVAVA